jgi:hypothetical protein
MAPPRRPPHMPAVAKPASAETAPQDDVVSDGTAGGGAPANGAPTGGKDTSDGGKDASANGGPARDAARPAAADATVVDGVPALPADTIGSSRVTRPKGSEADQSAPQSVPERTGDDSPVSFGPAPSAPAYPAKPSGNDPSAPASTAKVPPGPASAGPVAPGRPSPGGSPAPAGQSPVSPASFAWEMPDPPSNSPSSPARNFLRSGLTLRGVTPKAGSSGGSDRTAAAEDPAPAQKAPSQKAPSQKAQSKRTARQAHLTIARVEPWSVTKFSFVVSLVAFVILFVAVSVLYGILSGLGVFDSLQRVVTSVTSSQGSAGVNAKAWFTASRVLGYTAVLGVINIVLITAMSTIGAVVYNLTSRLVGGVEVTLRETE